MSLQTQLHLSVASVRSRGLFAPVGVFILALSQLYWNPQSCAVAASFSLAAAVLDYLKGWSHAQGQGKSEEDGWWVSASSSPQLAMYPPSGVRWVFDPCTCSRGHLHGHFGSGCTSCRSSCIDGALAFEIIFASVGLLTPSTTATAALIMLNCVSECVLTALFVRGFFDGTTGSMGTTTPGQVALCGGFGRPLRKALSGEAAVRIQTVSCLEVSKSVQSDPGLVPLPRVPAHSFLVPALSGRSLACRRKSDDTLHDMLHCVAARTSVLQHAFYLTVQGKCLAVEMLQKTDLTGPVPLVMNVRHNGGSGIPGAWSCNTCHPPGTLPTKNRCFRCSTPRPAPGPASAGVANLELSGAR